MSTSFESRPISRSRTQPPTISARPPAAPTADAIALARSSGSVSLVAIEWSSSELLREAIAESRREGVEPDQAAGLRVRIDFRNRPRDGARHRVGDGVGRLPRAERALDGAAGFPRHHVEELGVG